MKMRIHDWGGFAGLAGGVFGVYGWIGLYTTLLTQFVTPQVLSRSVIDPIYLAHCIVWRTAVDSQNTG
jgi:hypothetical protein